MKTAIVLAGILLVQGVFSACYQSAKSSHLEPNPHHQNLPESCSHQPGPSHQEPVVQQQAQCHQQSNPDIEQQEHNHHKYEGVVRSNCHQHQEPVVRQPDQCDKQSKPGVQEAEHNRHKYEAVQHLNCHQQLEPKVQEPECHQQSKPHVQETGHNHHKYEEVQPNCAQYQEPCNQHSKPVVQQPEHKETCHIGHGAEQTHQDEAEAHDRTGWMDLRQPFQVIAQSMSEKQQQEYYRQLMINFNTLNTPYNQLPPLTESEEEVINRLGVIRAHKVREPMAPWTFPLPPLPERRCVH